MMKIDDEHEFFAQNSPNFTQFPYRTVLNRIVTNIFCAVRTFKYRKISRSSLEKRDPCRIK